MPDTGSLATIDLVLAPKFLLIARERPAVAVLADLTDRPLVGTLVGEPEIDLRAPLSLLEELDDLEQQYARQLPINEATLAPRLLRPSTTGFEFRLAVSNYSRFLAAVEIFGRTNLEEQSRILSSYSTGVPPWFSHSLGVNCSLETADGKLIWTVRPDGSLEGNRLSAVMSEGATPWDVVDGTWTPETTARRGFHEELGFSPISTDDELRLTFYAVVSQFGNGGVSINGHAITSLTLQEVLMRRHDAPDAHEHVNGLFVFDANPEALEAFIEANPVDNWTTWGASALYHLARHRLQTSIEGLELRPVEAPTSFTSR